MGPQLLFENPEIDWHHFSGPNPTHDITPECEEHPTLASLSTEHLQSVPTLLALHHDSVARGLVLNSEHGLLAFLATAQSSLRRGKTLANLFRWLIKAGLWYEATLEDEDITHAALKRYLMDHSTSFLKLKTPPSP